MCFRQLTFIYLSCGLLLSMLCTHVLLRFKGLAATPETRKHEIHCTYRARVASFPFQLTMRSFMSQKGVSRAAKEKSGTFSRLWSTRKCVVGLSYIDTALVCVMGHARTQTDEQCAWYGRKLAEEGNIDGCDNSTAGHGCRTWGLRHIRP